MKVLLAPTEPFIKSQHASLASDAAAGSSVAIAVDNSDGFTIHDFIVVGVEGSDSAELCQISGLAQTSITVTTLKLGHKQGDAIIKYRYDKRKFYGSLTSTGTFAELTTSGSPVSIQVDNPQGTFLEYTGTEGYAYFKSTYYNSSTLDETAITDADAVAGDESTRYTGLYAIRRKAGLTNNPFITDDRLENKRKQAENEINSAIYARYLLPLSEIPAIISQVAELLAAGYIDYEEFGQTGTGVKWLGEGRAILSKITTGTQRLLDSNYVELTRVTKSGVLDGYPDNTEPNGPTFSMSDKY